MRGGLASCVLGLSLTACGLFDFHDEPELSPVPFYSISVENGRTIAGGGDGRIYVTSDGQTWVESVYLSSWPIWAVHHDATNTEIGVGGPYWAANWEGTGWIGWNSGVDTELMGVGACLDAYWVAGAGGYAARSTDGNNWFPVAGISASSHMVDLACGPSFVLLASYAQQSGYWTSVDGSSATNVTSPADTCSVTHANGSFYALATDGRVFASPDDDANTWTEIDRIAWTELVPYCTIQHAADTFCAMGADTITCCDADWSACVELEIPEGSIVYDFDFQDDGVLQAVGPDGWFLETTCSDGVCETPTITTAKYDPSYSYTTPIWDGDEGGDGDGGSCDPCTSDADCTGVAQRNGVAGAACGGDGLCYACFQQCGAGGVNCSCITCAEGCGTDAVCTGGNLCTFEIDGKLPCE